MIISLVRLKTINEFTRGVNPTKDIVQVCIWSGIEIDVGVICPCLPSFRLLLRKVWPRLMGTTADTGAAKYEMKRRSNTQSSGIPGSIKRQATFRSLSSSSTSIKNKHGDGIGNTPGNIIKITEVGVEFEIARPNKVASRGGGESTASVTALVDSDGDSIQHGRHPSHNHGRGRGPSDGNNGATSFV